MSDKFPKFKAAAAQVAPVYMNREATLEKACRIIKETSEQGADLVVFPEVFIPGYPYWIFMNPPGANLALTRMLFKESVEVPGPVTEALCRAAKVSNINVVIGINEKSHIMGPMWNTNLVISREGVLLGKCRKLGPVWAERMIWLQGDGSALKVFDMDIGKLGTLICGVNANPLARAALLAQGEQIHVSNYPAFPPSAKIDLVEQVRIRSRATSHEGNIFTVTATSPFSPEMVDMLGTTPDSKAFFTARPNAYSAIFGPGGYIIKEIMDEEGIIYADIDIEEEYDYAQIVNTAGRDTRPDVLSINLNWKEDKQVNIFNGAVGCNETSLPRPSVPVPPQSEPGACEPLAAEG